MSPVDYYMDIAIAVAAKSKDPNTRVGAILISPEGKIVATGYNGMVAGANEKQMWDQKHPYVIHAEMNALLYAGREARGCQMYVTHAPCSQCLKHLLQAGVKVIRYEELTTKSKRPDSEVNSLRVLMESTNCLVHNMSDQTLLEELREA